MKETNEKVELSRFMKKALKRLEDKKERKTAKLYVPSLEEEITIQSLHRTEILEVLNMDENSDGEASDNFGLYKSVIQPNLKEVAKEMKNNGQIIEYTEVCNIFDTHEKNSILSEVFKLSGVTADKNTKVTVVKEVKN